MARPKATGETKSHQQHLLMTPTEIKAIDDWRYRNHISSRGEAIRRLCQNGLTVYEDIDTAFEEVSDIWDHVTDLHHNLWTIMMQVRERHDHANPPLPARTWTSEEVVDRAMDWTSDLVDQTKALYLNLLSLNNRVMTMSEPQAFAGAQRESRRQKETIDAMRSEVFQRQEEGKDNRRLGVVIDWMSADPTVTAKYEAMRDEQQEEFLERLTQHVKEVGESALEFTEEEQAKVRRTNDEPYDFRAVADLVAGQVLLKPEEETDAHVRYVLLHMPTADRTMIEIMVRKALAASKDRDVTFPDIDA